jgi:hypothetical protein
MNRRQLLGAVGAVGAGAALGRPGPVAAGHGDSGSKPTTSALGNLHLHFCGIHCAKNNPNFQIVTQHICGAVGGGMHQCILYDSHGKDARVLGVEYIISDEMFRKLPDAEKKFWHPHTYEVLAGGLIAPSMSADDEMAFMKALLTTWGKSWHTWPDPATPVPMGEPLLMWSFTGDGQGDEKVIAARDKEFGVTTADIRKKRLESIGYEVPAVPQPTDVNAIGRQWTASGKDEPTPRKK